MTGRTKDGATYASSSNELTIGGVYDDIARDRRDVRGGGGDVQEGVCSFG